MQEKKLGWITSAAAISFKGLKMSNGKVVKRKWQRDKVEKKTVKRKSQDLVVELSGIIRIFPLFTIRNK